MVAPYVEQLDAQRLRSCRANIIFAATEDSPHAASAGAAMRNFPGPDVSGPASKKQNVLLEYIEDEPVSRAAASNRLKKTDVADMKGEFTSDTCESIMSTAQKRAIKRLSMDDLITQHVLGRLGIEAKPESSSQEERQHLANLWFSINGFWCQEEIQHLAGVLSACLDGHGHGKMHVLVKNKHRECAGRWDMVAVWTAFLLKMFPANFVSAHCSLPDVFVCCVYFMPTVSISCLKSQFSDQKCDNS